ncbi:MAG TPA: PAS domain S-box protein, partial [Anaerolineales bacterium]|nr:PAS domain S-box protein [Anaerolineales bacterium]
MTARNRWDSHIRSWHKYYQISEKRSLYVVGFAFFLILISYILVYVFYPEHVNLQVIFFIVLFSQMVVGVLMLLKKRNIARGLAVVSMWLFFSVIGFFHEDNAGVILAGYLMIMIIAGFSLGPRFANWIFRLSTVSFVALWTVDFFDLYARPWTMPSVTVIYLIFAIILTMGGIYLNYILSTLKETLEVSRKFERRYRALFDSSQDTVLLMDLKLNVIEVNQKGEELFGYSQEEFFEKPASALFYKMEEVEAVAEELLKSRQISAFEHQIISCGGDLIDVESLPTLVSNEEGAPLYFQIILRDVRSRKKFEATLLEYQQRYQAMFDQVEYALFLLSMDLTVVAANPKAAALTNLPLKELIGSQVTEFITLEERAAFRQNFNLSLGERNIPTTHYTIIDQEGHRLWGETNFSVVENQENKPIYVQWIVRNITGQKKREQELENALNEMEALAMTDPLTGLRNRRSIQQYAMTALEDAWVKNNPVSLIMMDVDLLKKINDSYGHQAGDVALCHVADVLRNQKRGDDAASRWAGDEFLVILPNTNLHHAELAAIRFRQHIEA